MTDRIQNIIEEIRSKKNELSNLLKNEQQNARQASARIAQLEEQLSTKTNNEQMLILKVENLSKDLALAQQEVQSLKTQLSNFSSDTNSNSKKMENVQIDELVREIEYCIGQLKDNA